MLNTATNEEMDKNKVAGNVENNFSVSDDGL